MALQERSGTSISLVEDAKEIKVINTNVSYACAFMFVSELNQVKVPNYTLFFHSAIPPCKC